MDKRIVFRAGKVKVVEKLNYYNDEGLWSDFMIYKKVNFKWVPSWSYHYHDLDPQKKEGVKATRDAALDEAIDRAIKISKVLCAKNRFVIFDGMNKNELNKDYKPINWVKNLNTKLKNALDKEDYLDASRIQKIIKENTIICN